MLFNDLKTERPSTVFYETDVKTQRTRMKNSPNVVYLNFSHSLSKRGNKKSKYNAFDYFFTKRMKKFNKFMTRYPRLFSLSRAEQMRCATKGT